MERTSDLNDHAHFSPSSAHRWLNCTASADVATRYYDAPSEAGQEGSAAHYLLERVLVDGGETRDHLGRTIVVKEKNVERKFVVTSEMARDVDLGVRTVREVAQNPGISGVEARVDLSFLEPGMFGTTDIWHWGQDGVLTIVDFKFGRGDVDVERNDQLMIYAAGVWEKIRKEHGEPLPHRILLVVAQPRSIAPTPRVKTWSFPASEIGDVIERAYGAIAEARRSPRYVAGAWCRHCPALGECPATQPEDMLVQTVDMTVADAVHIMRRKDVLEKIVERAEKVLLDALLNGEKIAGFPLVTKMKHRQWRDADLARQRLVDEIGPQVLETPTPAGAEKCGAAGKAIAREFAMTPPGEPTIGRSDDKRPPYLAKTAEMMFPTKGAT
jgi:hypothetical protein